MSPARVESLNDSGVSSSGKIGAQIARNNAHNGELQRKSAIDLHAVSLPRLSCTVTENLTEGRESVQLSVSSGTTRADILYGQGEDEACQREDYSSP